MKHINRWVVSTILITPKFLSVLRCPYQTQESKKSHSGMAWCSFLLQWSGSVGSSAHCREKRSDFVTMGFAFNQHQELGSNIFYKSISVKKPWFCLASFGECPSFLFPGCLLQKGEVWCFYHLRFNFCPSVCSRCLSWDSPHLQHSSHIYSYHEEDELQRRNSHKAPLRTKWIGSSSSFPISPRKRSNWRENWFQVELTPLCI